MKRRSRRSASERLRSSMRWRSRSGLRASVIASPWCAREVAMPFRSAIAAVHPRLAVVLHDMLMGWGAWTAGTVLRWSLAPNPSPMTLFGPEVWLVLGAQGVIFWWTGLYKGLWRFAS